MSTYFFDQEANVSKLVVELNTWKGTPFLKSSRQRATKGAAANCVSFVEAVLVNIGAIQPIPWPEYVVIGGGETMRKLMLSTLLAIPEFEEVGLDAPLKPGDIIASSNLKEGNHLCIYLFENTVWHCVAHYDVSTVSVHEPLIWENRIAIFRVKIL